VDTPAYGFDVGTSQHSRLAADERREQLIELGLELLGQRPYDQISITELAKAAGISKGLLYHYFPTKADFVIAVLQHSREQLDERLALDSSLSPAAAIDASLDAFLGYAEEHATGFLAVSQARRGDDDAIRDDLAAGRRRWVGTLTDFAAALAEADRADVESPALETVLAAWLAFSDDVVARWLTTADLQRDQVRHVLRQALFANLASVAAIDRTPAAKRLAKAAARAAGADS
jgi:AcrR family transcriptional regulator